VLGSHGNLGFGAASVELDHYWLITKPFHLVGSRLPLARNSVDGHEIVSEHQRRLVPDENVADPAAGAALPLRAEAVYISFGYSNRTDELSGLPLEPTLPSEHQRRERDDNDQIDSESDEQRNQHNVTLALIAGDDSGQCAGQLSTEASKTIAITIARPIPMQDK
jgi:hypothetical protein